MLAPLMKALAVASAGTVAVGVILLTLVLLSTPRGLTKAASFWTAYTAGYAGIGVVALLLGERVQSDGEGGGRAGVWASLVVGGLMLTIAFRTWRKPAGEVGPPKIFERLDKLTARRLFLFGLFVPLINFKNMAIFLSAVSILVTAKLSPAQSFASLAAVVFLFTAGVLTPIVLFAVGRARAEPLLARFRAALERNTRPITIGVLTLFGSVFTGRGLYLLFA